MSLIMLLIVFLQNNFIVKHEESKLMSIDKYTEQEADAKLMRNTRCMKKDLSTSDALAFSFLNNTKYIGVKPAECDLLDGVELVFIKHHSIFNYETNQLNHDLIKKLKKQHVLPQKFKHNHKSVIYDSDNYYTSFQLNIDALTKKLDTDVDNLSCTLFKFDKVYNISEAYEKLIEEIIGEFQHTSNYTLYFNQYGLFNVKCFKIHEKKKIYEYSYHILPHNLQSLINDRINILFNYKRKIETFHLNEKIKFEKEKSSLKLKGKMNVLIMMFDSISYYHFKRIFPITYAYLSKDLHGNILYTSLNSVGENTYPNLISFLTGLVVEPIESINVTNDVNNYRNNPEGYFDNVPFIWNKYENQGYVTWFNVSQFQSHLIQRFAILMTFF